MRRFIPAILVLVLASGCGATGSTAGAPGDIELAAANAPRLTGSAGDASSAGAAVNAFGLDLFRLVAAGDPATNLVLSPASIALALSMARAGARGQTAAEMDTVLRDLGADGNAAWVAALDAALTARTGTFPDQAGKPQEVALRIANAPFAQRGMALEPAYLDALAARFGAGLRLVDYRTAPEAARGLINGWVAGQTEQRIPELIGRGAVTAHTRLVLVNAIYLKAAWQLAFFDGATAPAPFTRPDGSSLDVPMMHVEGQLGYAAGDGWRAVELPYVGGKLAMVVIVPDDLSTFTPTLDEPALASITAALAPREVNLGLPKFGAESRLDLGQLLGALGMPTAFGDAADFSGITAEEQLVIDAVVHQANIEVDEKGTEAAAATAVMIQATAMPADPVELTVHRPFLFALRDTETGAVVFLGRIADPTVAAGS